MKCESLVEIRFGNRVAMSEKALMVEERRGEQRRKERRENGWGTAGRGVSVTDVSELVNSDCGPQFRRTPCLQTPPHGDSFPS